MPQGGRILGGLVVAAVLMSPALSASFGIVNRDGQWQLGEILAVSGVATLVASMLAYFLAPFFKTRLREIRLLDRKAWGEDVLVGLRHDKEASGRVILDALQSVPHEARSTILTMFPAETQQREEAHRLSLEHAGQLSAVRANVHQTTRSVRRLARVTRELNDTVSRSTERLTNTLEQLGKEVGKLTQRQEEHTVRIERMDASMGGNWPEVERRHGDRRRHEAP